MVHARLALAAFLLLITTGCTGTPLRIPTQPIQPHEQTMGNAYGSSTGIMLFQFIPIGQNDRFNDAYAEALAKKPGATRLVDIEVQEDWFWAWILNGYTFTVRGTAVKDA